MRKPSKADIARVSSVQYPTPHQRYNRAWYLLNREDVKLRIKLWQESARGKSLRRHSRFRRTCQLRDIQVEDVRAMLRKQGSACGICRKEVHGREYDIDHDHRTGRVRGLLCNECNRGIGFLGDCYKTVLKAANYLRRAER